MVRINRVYTRTGDDGTTALAGGQRVPKDSLRIDAYGTIDELNSAIGIAVANGLEAPMREPFGVIQQVLFNLGAELATPIEAGQEATGPHIENRHVEDLETWIDEWNANLEPLTSFVLPGGDLTAAHLHLARTICRRAERKTFALSREEHVGALVTPYLNRLSDLLFVASRLQNNLSGNGDVLWNSRKF
ncbi:MAG: ATP:cob(I)alamin adenosyltransferase [Dehalococcoidia bacterium]|nr:ATP:cob(I)alamin adenosyltransferase [Dehalococcoidia bacterium]HCU99617.1 cob(I)yrinic acid a,c-diamide adenosyltransferase [Dehalococcoidia bacterium]|tara:strand:+ start:665 stop:1231 length:567 start_codon:yes stop_codon:yes gene_type:complete